MQLSLRQPPAHVQTPNSPLRGFPRWLTRVERHVSLLQGYAIPLDEDELRIDFLRGEHAIDAAERVVAGNFF